ncbi:glycosyltransferase [Halomonas urmiana]|uniref:Glycosyltransferase n=1 Tax=Halomonas urmiana TaxID=490901 RepID=A0A5R8MEL4_9GAMM|nr:ATP-grasp fold amidoligase family protein [Halomonas urmiana]TLF48579.1 glycosyltransferase [Halomonas urmiana]
MTTVPRKLYDLLPTGVQDHIKFISRLHYLPNFKQPSTYNEKINFRKRHYASELFVLCSDKVKVKEYVAEKLGDEIVIDTLYVGESLAPEQLRSLIEEQGAVVVKPNHNSGAVFILERDASDAQLREACDTVTAQLRKDYGTTKREPWYSDIAPRLLVERKLPVKPGEAALDYKFHVFQQGKGQAPVVILHVDFDRFTNHSRSYFTEALEWLPFSVKYPSIYQRIERPENYATMLEIARTLAEPFSYVRVDLYNLQGRIFFGEMTFAHESGFGVFTSRAYDLWMGNLWKGDPRY